MNISLINAGQNIKNLKKVEWRTFAVNDERKIFNPISVQNKIFGELHINIGECKDGFNNWIIEIRNSLNKLFCKEILCMEKNNKAMKGFDIRVDVLEYRQKGYRFGELMRLMSVMEMNENKSPSMQIMSKGSAVYFHSKYKFVPSNISFDNRDQILKTISNDSSINFADLSKKAQEISFLTKSSLGEPEKQRELCKETNNLALEYINRALKEKDPQKNHPFDFGMDMVLTREDVLKNREFFNKLYENHGIDFKI